MARICLSKTSTRFTLGFYRAKNFRRGGKIGNAKNKKKLQGYMLHGEKPKSKEGGTSLRMNFSLTHVDNKAFESEVCR